MRRNRYPLLWELVHAFVGTGLVNEDNYFTRWKHADRFYETNRSKKMKINRARTFPVPVNQFPVSGKWSAPFD